MSLGSYPQISLKEARARRDEARALVAQGINPYEHRKQQRRAVRFAAEQAFEAVFNQWVEFRRLSLKEGRQSTLSQILRIFNKNVLPILGGWSIYDINRRDLLDLLSRIEQRKALSTAEKCRAWLNQLFRYALVKIEHRLEMSTLLGAVQSACKVSRESVATHIGQTSKGLTRCS